MKFEEFSPKQLAAMLWWKAPGAERADGVICDGSVRSGKTISMSIGFLLWSMSRFDNQSFALCGKTIEALRRNVIFPLTTWVEGIFYIQEHKSQNYFEVTVDGKKNRFYLFGGRDESSAALIQGMTLAGVLLDEVALMPRSFVEQALARCSVQGSKFWFNCNPDSPEHWFYKEFVKGAAKKNLLHFHFTMADNFSLADEVRKRYENLYSGVFHDRYIKGLWRVAEGLVYPQFDDALHTVDAVPDYGTYYISVDYGTLNPFSAGLWCMSGEKAVRIKEFYYDGRKSGRQKTDEEYYSDIKSLAGDYPITYIIVDPSAASFIECIRRHSEYTVRKARNEVLDGIRTVANMLNSGKIKIHTSCRDSIREFKLYRWDEKGTEDRVLKENDHAMDEIRYFAYTVLRREFGWNW